MEEQNKVNHYYISLPSQKREEDIIDFEIKMLEQNQIRGLLPAAREYQDTEVKIYFDISGRQNLEQRYTWQKLTGQEVKQILCAIEKVAAELEEYMLDYNHLNLMPEFMYGMLDPGDLCFCYEPWDSETFGERLRPLALWFLDHMDYREREEVIFSYEFQRFCDENEVSLALLGQFMAEKQAGKAVSAGKERMNLRGSRQAEEGAGAKARSRADKDSVPEGEEEESGYTFPWEEADPYADRRKSGGMKDLFRRLFPAGGRAYPDYASMGSLRIAEDETEYGKSTVRGRKNRLAKNAGGSEQSGDSAKNTEAAFREKDAGQERGDPCRRGRDTEDVAGKPRTRDPAGKPEDTDPADGRILSEEEEEPQTERPILGKLTSGKMPPLYIRGFPCFLGRDEDFSDCKIEDESVGRIHARLYQSEDRIWVEDLHSESGTFVNGDRMEPSEPWILNDGDELRLGRCSYRYHKEK